MTDEVTHERVTEDIGAVDISPPPFEVLVVGCGNLLRGDDAAGPVLVRRLRDRGLPDGMRCVDGGTAGMVGGTASTVVHFADLGDDEVDAYVATGEPLRVAGAFTIDGLGGPFVTGIEGDPHNVVGVSLPLVRELLGELGVGWHTLRTP